MIHIDDIIPEVINKNGIILNTSFREYVMCFEHYYVEIHPFTYKVYKYILEGMEDPLRGKHLRKIYPHNNDIIRDELNQFASHIYHHKDFRNKQLKYDPCDVFEIVSGFKIHTNNVSEYDIFDPIQVEIWKKKYMNDFNYFKYFNNNIIRKHKLNRILNEIN